MQPASQAKGPHILGPVVGRGGLHVQAPQPVLGGYGVISPSTCTVSTFSRSSFMARATSSVAMKD